VPTSTTFIIKLCICQVILTRILLTRVKPVLKVQWQNIEILMIQLPPKLLVQELTIQIAITALLSQTVCKISSFLREWVAVDLVNLLILVSEHWIPSQQLIIMVNSSLIYVIRHLEIPTLRNHKCSNLLTIKQNNKPIWIRLCSSSYRVKQLQINLIFSNIIIRLMI